MIFAQDGRERGKKKVASVDSFPFFPIFRFNFL